MPRSKIASLILAFVTVYLPTPVRATESKKMNTKQQNPYSRGTAKKVIGTILIPAGCVIGGTAILFSSLFNSDSEYDTPRQKETNAEARQNAALFGCALIAGSVVGGILLIRSGKNDRLQWNLWEEEHNPERVDGLDNQNAKLRDKWWRNPTFQLALNSGSPELKVKFRW